MNPNLKYIKQLDGFRFFAIAGVMIFHLITPGGPVFSKIPLGCGVNLFFVISGFLITTILFNIKEDGAGNILNNIKVFFIKRALRIFPIYYLTILFLFIIGFQNYKEVTSWMLGYGANIWISLNKPYLGSYNHLWSLAVEEQFYLFWPFIILFISKKYIKLTIYITIIISVLFKIYLFYINGFWVPAINAFTLSCMDILGLGALLAYYVKYEKEKYETYFLNKWVLLTVFIIYLLSITFSVIPNQWIRDVLGNTLFSVLALFILAPAVTDRYTGIFNAILQNKIIIHFGRISYGLYLYHFFMPDLYNYLVSLNILTIPGDIFKWSFYFAVCIIISELSWFLIERPILNLKKKVK
jgi:peptidoglycan/LPS O-acetylase OafA/YrhL